MSFQQDILTTFYLEQIIKPENSFHNAGFEPTPSNWGLEAQATHKKTGLTSIHIFKNVQVMNNKRLLI